MRTQELTGAEGTTRDTLSAYSPEFACKKLLAAG